MQRAKPEHGFSEPGGGACRRRSVYRLLSAGFWLYVIITVFLFSLHLFSRNFFAIYFSNDVKSLEPLGQYLMHLIQVMHFLLSVFLGFSFLIAFSGQFFTHIPHFLHCVECIRRFGQVIGLCEANVPCPNCRWRLAWERAKRQT